MCSVNRSTFHILAIIVFTLLPYSNTFDVPFMHDDLKSIVVNPVITDLNNFIDAASFGRSADSVVVDKPLLKMRYLGYLTFALNYAVHGLDVRGYHMVNILIHLCTSLLLYRLVILTFKTPRFAPVETPHELSGSRDFIALFSALLFAVHPVQTQAVTYVVQRFASLATLFCLLSLVGYVQFRLSFSPASPGYKRYFQYAASLVAAVLAMKTKEFALLLPVVIFLYEVMFFESRLKERLVYLAPLCLTMLIVPLSLLNTGDAGLDESAAKISGAYGGISRLDYLYTQFRVIVTYIRLLLFPVNQIFDYDYPIYSSFFIPEVATSFLFIFSIIFTGVYLFWLSRNSARRHYQLYRLASFGIFWFFITISAESSIIPIADVIFEHRLYQPSIGFILAFVVVIELLREKWARGSAFVLKASAFVLFLLTIGFSIATYARNSVWRDKIGFMKDEVNKSPGKMRPHLNLGFLYARQGFLFEAINEYKLAMRIDPYSASVHNNLGNVYGKLGRMAEALNEYHAALRLKPEFVEAHFNLGNSYAALGKSDEAKNEYREALRLNPDFIEARRKLGQ